MLTRLAIRLPRRAVRQLSAGGSQAEHIEGPCPRLPARKMRFTHILTVRELTRGRHQCSLASRVIAQSWRNGRRSRTWACHARPFSPAFACTSIMLTTTRQRSGFRTRTCTCARSLFRGAQRTATFSTLNARRPRERKHRAATHVAPVSAWSSVRHIRRRMPHAATLLGAGKQVHGLHVGGRSAARQCVGAVPMRRTPAGCLALSRVAITSNRRLTAAIGKRPTGAS